MVIEYRKNIFNIVCIIRIRSYLVKHLIIKISERSFAQRFDDSMSSFSSEKRVKFDNLIYIVQNYLLKFVFCYMHILRFIALHGILYIKLSSFILFSLENDDMESSKRSVKLLSVIFIIRLFVLVINKS